MKHGKKGEVRGIAKLLLAPWVLKADFPPRLTVPVRVSARENRVHQAGY